MVFSFRFWWLCNSKHTEGVPMAQLFATGIYTTIWTLPFLVDLDDWGFLLLGVFGSRHGMALLSEVR